MTKNVSVNDRVVLPDGRLGIVWKKVLNGRAVHVFPYVTVEGVGEKIDWTTETYFVESLTLVSENAGDLPE